MAGGRGRAPAVVVLLAVLATACGQTVDDSAPRLSSLGRPFCDHVQTLAVTLQEVQGAHPLDLIHTMLPIRDGLTADQARFGEAGAVQLSDTAGALSAAVEVLIEDLQGMLAGGSGAGFSEDLIGTFDTVGLIPTGYCVAPDEYRWVTDDPMTVEVSVPDEWRVEPMNWVVDGIGRVGTGLIASSDPDVWSGEFPAGRLSGVFLARSDSLAASLDLDDVRTGLAMDRLREWARTFDWRPTCRLDGVEVFTKFFYYGFLRTWRDCGSIGTDLVEVFVLRPLVSGGMATLVMQATASAPSDQGIVTRLVDSFHAVTG